jgi:hypothetical protein
MKYLLPVLLFALIVACGDEDNNTQIVTPPIVKYVPDTIWKPLVGYTYKYKAQDGQEAKLEIIAENDFEWCLDFWDTTRLSTFKTYICKFTEYEGTFPRVTMFGAAVSDTNIYWGKRDVNIIDKWDRLPFYVSLCRLNSRLSDTSIAKEYNFKIANVDFRCADSVVYIPQGSFIYQDSLVAKQYLIQSFKKNTYTDITLEGDEFIFAEKFGFTRIWKYVLYDYLQE